MSSSLLYAFTKYLQAELERAQKRAFSCIFPGVSYKNALIVAAIDCMESTKKCDSRVQNIHPFHSISRVFARKRIKKIVTHLFTSSS